MASVRASMPSAGVCLGRLRGQLVDEPAQAVVIHRGQRVAEDARTVARHRRRSPGASMAARSPSVLGRRLGRQRQIAVPLSGQRGHRPAELVGDCEACNRPLDAVGRRRTCRCRRRPDRTCSVPLPLVGETVSRNAPPSVELPPRAFQYMSATGVKRGIFAGQAGQRGVDGLLLRADQPDRDLALLQARRPAAGAWPCR